MSKESVIAALEKLGVEYRVGRAVEHLLAAQDAPDDAACYREVAQAMGRLGVWPAPPEELAPVVATPPATAPAPPATAPRQAAPKPQPQPKPAAKPSGGSRPGQHGYVHPEKVCARCKVSKGLTAYPKGSDTCFKCAGIQTKPQPTKPATPAAPKPVTTQGGVKRRCERCGEMQYLQRFPAEGRVCQTCVSKSNGAGEYDEELAVR